MRRTSCRAIRRRFVLKVQEESNGWTMWSEDANKWDRMTDGVPDGLKLVSWTTCVWKKHEDTNEKICRCLSGDAVEMLLTWFSGLGFKEKLTRSFLKLSERHQLTFSFVAFASAASSRHS